MDRRRVFLWLFWAIASLTGGILGGLGYAADNLPIPFWTLFGLITFTVALIMIPLVKDATNPVIGWIIDRIGFFCFHQIDQPAK